MIKQLIQRISNRAKIKRLQSDLHKCKKELAEFLVKLRMLENICADAEQQAEDARKTLWVAIKASGGKIDVSNNVIESADICNACIEVLENPAINGYTYIAHGDPPERVLH